MAEEDDLDNVRDNGAKYHHTGVHGGSAWSGMQVRFWPHQYLWHACMGNVHFLLRKGHCSLKFV